MLLKIAMSAVAVATAAPVFAWGVTTTVDLTRVFTGTILVGSAQTTRYTFADGGWGNPELLDTQSLAGAPFTLTFNARFDDRFGYWQADSQRSASLWIGGAAGRTVSADGIGFALTYNGGAGTAFTTFDTAVFTGFYNLATASSYFSPLVNAGRLRTSADDAGPFDPRGWDPEDFVPLSDLLNGTVLNAAFVGYAISDPVTSSVSLEHLANGQGRVDRFQQFVSVTSVTNPPAAVPEPASWALLVTGFAAMGGVLRAWRVHPA